MFGLLYTLTEKAKAALCVVTFDILYLQIFPQHAMKEYGKVKLQFQSFVTLALDQGH